MNTQNGISVAGKNPLTHLLDSSSYGQKVATVLDRMAFVMEGPVHTCSHAPMSLHLLDAGDSPGFPEPTSLFLQPS